MSDPVEAAKKIVEAYLERSMVPDPAGAAAYVAQDFSVTFTGGRRFSGPADTSSVSYGTTDDSKYCRNCHNVEGMELENQGRLAQRRHSKMAERGQTCIDCHYGLVHRLPENSDEILKKIQEEFASVTPESDSGTRVAAGD